MSLPGAKNAIFCAIEALYYRPLNKDEKNRIWDYFNSRCAYCDKLIDRDDRHGHMNYFNCSATGEGNYIRNRVLACEECNGNEKRELEWRGFLRSKCTDERAARTPGSVGTQDRALKGRGENQRRRRVWDRRGIEMIKCRCCRDNA